MYIFACFYKGQKTCFSMFFYLQINVLTSMFNTSKINEVAIFDRWTAAKFRQNR